VLLALVLALATDAPVDPVAHSFSFAAVPTLTFDTDEGFGTGGVVTLYHQNGAVLPYRDAITFNLFISSKLVQAHAITWDAIKPFDIDGRMYLRLGYYATVSENYCGVGNDVTCAPGVPAALDRDLDDDFNRHYYLMRFIKPYANAIFRPWLRDKPYRTELLFGWRGAWIIPGDLTARGPYPGSLFAHDHPDGEAGISSVPFVGVVVDDRDAETFPTRGIYSEASVRFSHPFTGSTWTYAGADAQLASFFSLSDVPRLVLATRIVGDVIVGDPPVVDMARIGGTVDAIAFGGYQIGRGVREERYLGRVKVLAQAELRAQFISTPLLGQDFNHGAALFSDVGWIGASVDDVGHEPLKLLSTVGISYRLLWNEDFSIRMDLAVSPDEYDGPGFYVIVGQDF
jgi:hypothetical protein